MKDEVEQRRIGPVAFRATIISLLDVNRRYNLAESTAQDLTFHEVLELAGGAAALDGLAMDYGSSAGLPGCAPPWRR